MLCPPDLYNLALCYKMVHFFQLAIWLVGQPVLFHFVIQIIWSTLHRSCWTLCFHYKVVLVAEWDRQVDHKVTHLAQHLEDSLPDTIWWIAQLTTGWYFYSIFKLSGGPYHQMR